MGHALLEPVGNSPELMCWDCTLNKDVDDEFNRHQAYTKQLNASDPLKFCKSTPTRIDSAYLRLVDPKNGLDFGVPTSARIIQDIQKCMGPNLIAIIEAKGAVVQELGNRNGHRKAVGVDKRGGKREKSALQAVRWVHPDAVEARANIVRESILRYNTTF